ncbi:MAG: Membrane protein [Ilumatobacteraceae bacterium]|nr:Membrane protein [Ilumatobacteraceae bacterium]MCU1389641.1 Membrane protein [Ilumatobacteraceae bacterium]
MLEEVRLAVYRSLAETGRLPSADHLDEVAGSHARAAASIVQLAQQRAWALGANGEIELAHPFGTRSFGYSVMSTRTLWWGGCCWDAFAIPHLVPECGPVVIAGLCPSCSRALSWRVDTTGPPTGSERAHFLVPTSRMWDDVIHTCSNQLLFCDDSCIDKWLEATGNHEGYRMDLPTLWRFAANWYSGRLDRGYRRREPAEALSYFQDVGLRGSFWGLPDNP